MPASDPAPQASPVFDPQTWVDLLTVHSLKNDFFSARTLMVIHEGVERLAKARARPGSLIVITASQANLFERLFKAFNNPHLLKEAGLIYLQQFKLPDSALKHLDLARQFAPGDRDIEPYQVAAALAIARDVTDKSGHSGIDEAEPPKPHAEVDAVLRKTSKLAHVVQERQDLDESNDDLERKTKSVKLPATPPYQPSLTRAEQSVADGDFGGAAATLEEARQLGAPKGQLQASFAQVGLAAFDAGEWEWALAAFGRVREIGPEDVEGWFNCGLVYQKLSRLDDALAAYKQALKIAPDNSKIWCNLSSVWYELGNPAESEQAARECLRLKVDYARAWDNLASALSAQGKLPEAANACQQAIRIQPQLTSAWFKLGVVNFQMDNMRVAAEAFETAHSGPAFTAYVNYYLAMIDARRGELDSALQRLEEARVTDPDNELESATVKEIAGAFTKSGDHPRAADLFGQVTKKHPDDFSAWLALGTALHRADKFAAARDAYEQATELNADNPLPWHNLGLLASDEGKYEEARTFFQREVEIAPDDAKAWYDLGVSLQKLGHEEQAAEAFDKSEDLVKSLARRSSDLSAALSIVRRLNLTGRMLKTE